MNTRYYNSEVLRLTTQAMTPSLHFLRAFGVFLIATGILGSIGSPLGWSHFPLFSQATCLKFALFGMVFLYSFQVLIVEINSEGIRLYRINMLRWDDVDSASVRNLVGLRYLLVKRRKGVNYWIPLYFKGDIRIEDAIRENAPTDNPLVSCI